MSKPGGKRPFLKQARRIASRTGSSRSHVSNGYSQSRKHTAVEGSAKYSPNYSRYVGELSRDKRSVKVQLLHFIWYLSFFSYLNVSAPAQEIHDDLNFRKSLVSRYLKNLGLEIDNRPNGKKIHSVLIASEDVVTQADPWPLFLANLHFKTKNEVIENELLFQKGDPWDSMTIEESSRNLRENLFLSVAEILPCKSQAKNHVDVLVVTKDLWSLRLNTDFSYVGSTLEYLEVQLEETNLFGQNNTARLQTQMNPFTLSLGQFVALPRIASTRVNASELGTIIFNKNTHSLEGGTADFRVGKPLFSLGTKWGWSGRFYFLKNFFRIYSGSQLSSFLTEGTKERIPLEYGRKRQTLQFRVTRSFGTTFKNNFSLEWEGRIKSYSLTRNSGSASPLGLAEFQSNYFPRSETAGVVSFSYTAFQPSYTVLIDFDTFALAEDTRLGPNWRFSFGVANPALGFESKFLELEGNLGYTHLFQDNLLHLSFVATVRHQPNLVPNHTWIYQSYDFSLRNSFPKIAFFRPHFGLSLIHHIFDLDHKVETLGGNGRLRGYPTSFLNGPYLWVTNFELRTQPEIFNTLHYGGALFFDMGSAALSTSNLLAHASVGAGVRILFPQFNRQVFRLDGAIPLESATEFTPSYIVARFEQAF